jgi:nucleotidyltransferase substrate binding protein (TIGR01987 family)
MAYELSWKSLKKVLLEQGHQTLGAKDVFSKAFQLGYLKEQGVWLEMIEDRNLTAHVYDEDSAKKIVDKVRGVYFGALENLGSTLQ